MTISYRESTRKVRKEGVSHLSSSSPLKDSEDLVRDTPIDSNGPGTILRDVEAALDFFATVSPALMADRTLPPGVEQTLDERLYGKPDQAGDFVQPFFAHIHGIFLLLRASGLTKVISARRGWTLTIDSSAEERWQTFSAADRYFTLLETWLLYGDADTLAGRQPSQQKIMPLDLWWNFFRILKPQTFYEEDLAEQRRFWPAVHNLALMQMFGLISVVDVSDKESKGWQTDAVLRTTWGDSLLSQITGEAVTGQNRRIWYNSGQRGISNPGQLQSILQPVRPDWTHALSSTVELIREGLFFFKVSLDKNLWRQAALPAESTLQDLSDAILHAYGFNHDHLFRFFYPDHLGLTQVAQHPDLDGGPHADEVRIGDLSAGPGFHMVYNYDFVEDWLFDIELITVVKGASNLSRYGLGPSSGRSPDQYHGQGGGWLI